MQGYEYQHTEEEAEHNYLEEEEEEAILETGLSAVQCGLTKALLTLNKYDERGS